MALPKLNNTPYYDVTIPSTGETTTYRPYLVKEEKILLMALETADYQQVARAMFDIVCTCVNDTKRNKLTTFDMEYLFLKVRSKSVGETAKFLLQCQSEECHEQNEVTVKLSDVEIDLPKDKNNTIELKDDMILELKYPTYNDMINDRIIAETTSDAEMMYQTVMLCLDVLHIKDERMLFSEEPVEDIVEFIGSLTTEQFAKINAFANSIPVIEKEVEFKCKKCNHDNNTILSGTMDFFQ